MAGSIRVVFDGQSFRNKITARHRETLSAVSYGMSGGARDMSVVLLRNGRARIASSGNFGSARWLQGFNVAAFPQSGALTNARIQIWHDVPYAHIHDKGGLIRGKPLLWIPLSHATEAKGVYARDYPGGLFRVDRVVGRPLLLSIVDKKPKYFGIAQVTIPARWNLEETVIMPILDRFGTFYDANVRFA